jgi:hypothetical protein
VSQEVRRAAAANAAAEAEAAEPKAERVPEAAAQAPAPRSVPVPSRPLTRGRRSSIAVAPQLSVIPELSGGASPVPSAGGLTPANAVLRHAEAEAAAADDAGADANEGAVLDTDALEGEGLTTRLMQLMDDEMVDVEGMSEPEVPEDTAGAGADDAVGEEGAQPEAAADATPEAEAPLPRISIGGGRGSVGSNMIGATATLMVGSLSGFKVFAGASVAGPNISGSILPSGGPWHA